MSKIGVRFCTFLLLVHTWGQSMAIFRSTVISRAETWLHPPVPYSQTAFKNGYRTDCSGYVSMAWQTGTNYNTNTLSGISTAISKNDLKSGDILLKPGTHVTIFKGWVDSSKTKYWGYEQVGGSQRRTKYWQIPYPYWENDHGYSPRRYNGITD